MRVLEVKDKEKARKLTNRLIKRGFVVAEVTNKEGLEKEITKKADVVILVSNGEKVP